MRLLASLPGRLVTTWSVILAAVTAVLLVALIPVPDSLEPRSSSGLPGSYESVQAMRTASERAGMAVIASGGTVSTAVIAALLVPALTGP